MFSQREKEFLAKHNGITKETEQELDRMMDSLKENVKAFTTANTKINVIDELAEMRKELTSKSKEELEKLYLVEDIIRLRLRNASERHEIKYYK